MPKGECLPRQEPVLWGFFQDQDPEVWRMTFCGKYQSLSEKSVLTNFEITFNSFVRTEFDYLENGRITVARASLSYSCT